MDCTAMKNCWHTISQAILNQSGRDRREIGGQERMKLDFQAESIKATPAVIGTGVSGVASSFHLDWAQVAGAATVFYIALQAAYLIWKWVREVQGKTP